MPDKEDTPGIVAIRKLLTAAFDDAGLDAFALDNYPDVVDRFSRGLRKDGKATLPLDHCRWGMPTPGTCGEIWRAWIGATA